MCGLPGSGKSTYLFYRAPATLLLAADDLSTIILCPDEFRLALTGKDFHEEAEDSVSSHVKIAARVLLKRGHHVIIDEVNLTIAKRKEWVTIAKDTGVYIHCLWQNVPFEVSIERNKNRSRIVPDAVMTQMMADFVPPTISEGFTSVQRLSDKLK